MSLLGQEKLLFFQKPREQSRFPAKNQSKPVKKTVIFRKCRKDPCERRGPAITLRRAGVGTSSAGSVTVPWRSLCSKGVRAWDRPDRGARPASVVSIGGEVDGEVSCQFERSCRKIGHFGWVFDGKCHFFKKITRKPAGNDLFSVSPLKIISFRSIHGNH